MNYALIFVLLGILVLVHEAGHLVAARLARVPVERFSVGFGPKLWSFRRKGIEYRLSAFPLGGYILPRCRTLDAYFKIPVWKRVVMSLGGPAANLALPLPLFALGNVLAGGFTFSGLFLEPFAQTAGLLGAILTAIPRVFAEPGALSGVVGIVVEGGKYSGLDPLRFLAFASVLSLNLSILNLLPVPVLDGGKIVLSLAEKVHPAAKRAFVPATIAGWILIFGLLFYATAVDVFKYVV
jgi:membrane-associated protease RseP (regulator of RpoE activity)